jgi:hypothetical protein
MPPKRQKRVNVKSSSSSETDNAPTCPIYKMPAEIMEMIFGRTNFADLPYFICASKTIYVELPLSSFTDFSLPLALHGIILSFL